MAAPSNPLEKYEQDLLRLSVDGLSSRKIVDWLRDQHGVKTNRDSVAKYIKKIRTERAETSKMVAREKLSTIVVSDLDRLEEICREAERRAKTEKKNSIWVKLGKLEFDIRVKRLELSGASQPDAAVTELAAAEERVNAKLEKLAKLAAAADSAGKPE